MGLLPSQSTYSTAQWRMINQELKGFHLFITIVKKQSYCIMATLYNRKQPYSQCNMSHRSLLPIVPYFCHFLVIHKNHGINTDFVMEQDLYQILFLVKKSMHCCAEGLALEFSDQHMARISCQSLDGGTALVRLGLAPALMAASRLPCTCAAGIMLSQTKVPYHNSHTIIDKLQMSAALLYSLPSNTCKIILLFSNNIVKIQHTKWNAI